MGDDAREITDLLRAWSKGDLEARDRLVPLVYQELRRRAADQLRRERRGHTLQPTALVHEAYLRLVDVLDFETALTRLASFDRRKSRIVELRFFGGLSLQETGEVLGVSIATVERDWQLARAWLFNALTEDHEPNAS